MKITLLAIAALGTFVEAAPAVHNIKERSDISTASERLGLAWLGGNSSLPKILSVVHLLRIIAVAEQP
jgi:hypothetical protein